MEFGHQSLSSSLACLRPAHKLVTDQLRTGLQSGSSYVDMSTQLEPVCNRLETRSATSSRAAVVTDQLRCRRWQKVRCECRRWRSTSASHSSADSCDSWTASSCPSDQRRWS